jgi:hypothetical protein
MAPSPLVLCVSLGRGLLVLLALLHVVLLVALWGDSAALSWLWVPSAVAVLLAMAMLLNPALPRRARLVAAAGALAILSGNVAEGVWRGGAASQWARLALVAAGWAMVLGAGMVRSP